MPLTPLRKSVPLKGINTVTPPRSMSDEYAVNLSNCWFDDGVTLRRRLAQTVSNPTITPAAGVARKMFEYRQTASQRFLQSSTGAVYLDTGTDLIVQTGVTYANKVSTAKLGANLIIGDGSGPAQVYNGTTWAAPTTTPDVVRSTVVGSIFHTHRGRCYAAGDPAYPMTLFYSDTIANTGILNWNQLIPTAPVGAKTTAVGFATGSVTIALAAAGTGAIVKGNMIAFAGDPNQYEVVTGIANVSRGGNVTIKAPGLVAAIPATATAVIVTGGVNLGGFIDISGDLSEGDVITGLTTHRGYLVVFCTKHIIFYIIDESNGYKSTLYKAIGGEGCITHHSIQQVGEETLYLSDNGFKRLSVSLVQGDSQVNDLSTPINNEVKALLRSGTVLISSIESTYNPRYGLYVCNLGATSYVYQTTFDAWFKWTGIQPVIFTDSDNITYSANTHISRLDNTAYQDTLIPASPSAISMLWEAPPYRSPSTDYKPRWIRFEMVYEVDAASDSLTVEYFFDLNISVVVTATHALAPTFTLGNGLFTGKFELPMQGRSELVSVRVSNASNTDFRMKLQELYMSDGGLR